MPTSSLLSAPLIIVFNDYTLHLCKIKILMSDWKRINLVIGVLRMETNFLLFAMPSMSQIFRTRCRVLLWRNTELRSISRQVIKGMVVAYNDGIVLSSLLGFIYLEMCVTSCLHSYNGKMTYFFTDVLNLLRLGHWGIVEGKCFVHSRTILKKLLKIPLLSCSKFFTSFKENFFVNSVNDRKQNHTYRCAILSSFLQSKFWRGTIHFELIKTTKMEENKTLCKHGLLMLTLPLTS